MPSTQSLDRAQRLQHDLEDMAKIKELAPSVVRFTTRGRARYAPEVYEVEVRIKGIVGIDRSGLPRYCDHFKLEIHLTEKYPEQQGPQCRIYPVPFHPHVKKMAAFLGQEYGLWIDPQNTDEGLGTFVLYVIQSLRYHPKFIDTDAYHIGNQEALAWYVYWCQFFAEPKSWFPTDDSQVPERLNHKKFDIQTRDVKMSTLPNDSVDRGEGNHKMFQIISMTPPYKPEVAPFPDFGDVYRSNFRGSHKSHHIYIRRKAFDKIMKHISWGKTSADNQVEQGGILLGRAFRDTEQSLIYSVVEDAIAGTSAIGTRVYLEMNHITWKEMIDRVDRLLEAEPENQLQIIGWYHTHPNELDVFMSGTDTTTQRLLFAEDWQFAVVINPHKKIWRAFHGKNAEECEGFITRH